MPIETRRSFLSTISVALGAAAVGPRALAQGGASHVVPLAPLAPLAPLPSGLQLYTVRAAMKQDLPGTLARVAAIGYREVEFAGYFDRSPVEIRDLLAANGLRSPATHIPFATVDSPDDGWAAALDASRTMGHEWVVMPWLPAILAAMATDPQTPPQGMDWDLFLGPAQPVPYHPVYHPFSWRGWVDFGTGALGDMGAHLMDQAYWALDLGYPTSVAASGSPWGGGSEKPASFPLATTAEYEFPARGARPAVKLYWYDSGLMPPRPPFLPDDVTLPRGDGGGGVLVGERGIITYETYGNNPMVYPEPVARAAAAVPKTLPRITTTHELNWVQACKGEATASSPFDYAAKLTETMLLGVAALRAGPGRLLRYDGERMQFSNAPDANQYLTRDYRAGWAL